MEGMKENTSAEIHAKLTAINQHLLRLMVILAAKKQKLEVEDLLEQGDLQKYFTANVGIPINVVYHYAELAGEREGISWHLNRLNYIFSTNQENPGWLVRFLDRVERKLAYQLRKADLGPGPDAGT
jgi:hypothetical protein